MLVCLAFTGVGVAWADPTSVDLLVPRTAPGSEHGSTVRVGTAVGFIYGAPTDVLALGVTGAIGQRFGRFDFEAEGTWLGFRSRAITMDSIGYEDNDISVGSGKRLDAMVRFDALRFGPTIEKNRALFTVYVEGGAGVAWNHWTRASSTDPSRIIPDDTRRTEGQAGFGLQIFPHRVAWLIGWRFAVAPHQDMTGSICRGVSCRAVTMTTGSNYVDDSMLFQSSLEFTF